MAILDNFKEDINTADVSFMPTAQKWGLYLTAASVIFTILMSLIGFKFDTMSAMIFFSLVSFALVLTLLIVFGVFAIREHRTNLGGFIDFKQAFLVCFAAFMVSVVIGSAFNFVYHNYINPSFMEDMRESMNTLFEEKNVPEANRAEALKGIDASKTIAGTLKSMVSGTVMSAIMAAIMAAIMKKARPMF